MILAAFQGIRGRILAIAALAFFPPALFGAFESFEAWQAAEGRARAYLAEVAEEVAGRHAQAVDDLRRTVTLLADQAEVRRAAESRGDECRAILIRLHASVSRQGPWRYTNLALNDVETGLPLCSVLTGQTSAGVGRVPWFTRIAATGSFGFGGYRVGLVTGKPIMIGGALVHSAEGKAAAVLLGTIDLSTATAPAETWVSRPGLTATIVSEAGLVLFRYPETDMVGRAVADTPLVQAAAAIPPSGIAEGPDLDGEIRLSAIRRLPGSEAAFVSVSQPAAEVHAESRARLLYHAALLLLTALCAGTAAWLVGERLILRTLRRLRESTRRLADGDHAARVDSPASGELRDLAGSFNDMAATVQRRTEEVERQRRHIAQALAQVQAIFAAMTEGVLIRDAEGRIIDANPAAEAILARPRAEILGTGFDRSLPWRPVDAAGAPVPLALNPTLLALRTGEVARGVITGIERPDGERRWLSLNTGIARDSAGAIALSVTSFTDVTERLQAEDRQRQSQKMELIGQLTGGIAHDFNNLLMVMISNLDCLAEDHAGSAEQRELVEGALRTALRGAELVRKLMSISRRKTLAVARTEIAGLIGGLAPILQRTLDGLSQVVPDLRDAPLHCLIDPGELENALINLAVNARDAMPRGGRIAIGTRRVERGQAGSGEAGSGESGAGEGGPWAEISVTDQGAGMPPDVLARAFEPFFTTKEAGKGSGLGLAMVYGFARQSGGSASIASVPGRGTTVTLLLPLAEDGEEETRGIAEQTSGLRLTSDDRTAGSR